MKRTMADVRRQNASIGHHWFERGAMRFFSSRIESGLYAGRYFISSEAHHSWGERWYTVREALDSGAVETVSAFGAFATIADAREAAHELAREARK